MAGSVALAGARTPIGKLSGALASFAATELGGFAIKAALERAGGSPDQVDHVFMGRVVQTGGGQMTARQAALNAGIPMSVPSTTIDKVRLSGINAIHPADLMIQAGEADIVVAGGMESMTNTPYLLPGARGGYRIGDQTVIDSMMYDGLFDNEIVPVEVPQRRGESIRVSVDEGVRGETTADSLSKLGPAFDKAGNISAGNASQISDGGPSVTRSACPVPASPCRCSTS